MQVLMLSDVYFPRVNGVSTSIQSFRRALAAQGVEVRLLAPDYGMANASRPGSNSASNSASKPDSTPASSEDRRWITRLAARSVPFDPEDRYVRPSRFVAAGRCQSPALIHVQTPFAAHYAGIELARWHGVPVVATYHTFFEEYLHHYLPMLPAGLTRRAAREFSRRQCNALDALIVPSSAMCERLADYGVTVPMHVLPTGISLERFTGGDRAAFRQRLGISSEQPVALFVGRIAHEKNLDFLLDVARLCQPARPDLRWIFAGEGPALLALRARAQRLGLAEQTRFVGYLDREHELLDCYAAADLFAFASRTETQGLVLLEAMAMGLPVIALSAMGTTDIVGPQQGAITPPDDAREFAAAVLACLADDHRRAGLGIEARRYTMNWSEEASANRLAAFYRSICLAKADRAAARPASPLRDAGAA